jgi:hypothetical protein
LDITELAVSGASALGGGRDEEAVVTTRPSVGYGTAVRAGTVLSAGVAGGAGAAGATGAVHVMSSNQIKCSRLSLEIDTNLWAKSELHLKTGLAKVFKLAVLRQRGKIGERCKSVVHWHSLVGAIVKEWGV